jgi:6,7-dimethyl-8-ribityllumazine synthase
MATAAVNLSAYEPKNLPNAAPFKLGVVVAEWNAEITDALTAGALEVFEACGALPHNITTVKVPGTFELTYGAKLLCAKKEFDAVIVIGTVIQGETRHFDFVCDSVTQGITKLNLDYNTPVIFCVLTDNTIEQSRARAGGQHGNKGIECAVAALKMAALSQTLG